MIHYKGVSIQLPRSAATDEPIIADHTGGHPVGPCVLTSVAGAAGVFLDWLGSFPRRWGDRWFAMNDAEADGL